MSGVEQQPQLATEWQRCVACIRELHRYYNHCESCENAVGLARAEIARAVDGAVIDRERCMMSVRAVHSVHCYEAICAAVRVFNDVIGHLLAGSGIGNEQLYARTPAHSHLSDFYSSANNTHKQTSDNDMTYRDDDIESSLIRASIVLNSGDAIVRFVNSLGSQLNERFGIADSGNVSVELASIKNRFQSPTSQSNSQTIYGQYLYPCMDANYEITVDWVTSAPQAASTTAPTRTSVRLRAQLCIHLTELYTKALANNYCRTDKAMSAVITESCKCVRSQLQSNYDVAAISTLASRVAPLQIDENNSDVHRIIRNIAVDTADVRTLEQLSQLCYELQCWCLCLCVEEELASRLSIMPESSEQSALVMLVDSHVNVVRLLLLPQTRSRVSLEPLDARLRPHLAFLSQPIADNIVATNVTNWRLLENVCRMYLQLAEAYYVPLKRDVHTAKQMLSSALTLLDSVHSDNNIIIDGQVQVWMVQLRVDVLIALARVQLVLHHHQSSSSGKQQASKDKESKTPAAAHSDGRGGGITGNSSSMQLIREAIQFSYHYNVNGPHHPQTLYAVDTLKTVLDSICYLKSCSELLASLISVQLASTTKSKRKGATTAMNSSSSPHYRTDETVFITDTLRLHHLGMYLFRVGDSNNALLYLKQAYQQLTACYGDADNINVLLCVRDLALVCESMGHYEEAVSYRQTLISHRDEIAIIDVDLYHRSMHQQCSNYTNIGDCLQAFECYTQTLTLYEQKYGKYSTKYAALLKAHLNFVRLKYKYIDTEGIKDIYRDLIDVTQHLTGSNNSEEVCLLKVNLIRNVLMKELDSDHLGATAAAKSSMEGEIEVLFTEVITARTASLGAGHLLTLETIGELDAFRHRHDSPDTSAGDPNPASPPAPAKMTVAERAAAAIAKNRAKHARLEQEKQLHRQGAAGANNNNGPEQAAKPPDVASDNEATGTGNILEAINCPTM
jgi:tetratricopeptide (TPR) repeat protein